MLHVERRRKQRRTHRFAPRLDALEGRALLSTFTVTNDADSGPGSLRQAVLNANASSDTSNTITFARHTNGMITRRAARSRFSTTLISKGRVPISLRSAAVTRARCS
jgi:hypothetical protein